MSVDPDAVDVLAARVKVAIMADMIAGVVPVSAVSWREVIAHAGPDRYGALPDPVVRAAVAERVDAWLDPPREGWSLTWRLCE